MRAEYIPLGFRVPDGEPVVIPIGHMAVTGQTQAAGKTTTLEACAHNVPASYAVLAFTTKRGEGSFQRENTIQPFFRERADWEFVQAILEATLRERMKFERGWIMRASKGAATLRDVQHNVRNLMQTAKGMSADIYYQLDTYLDKVVPQIGRITWAPRLALAHERTNVMDLSAMSTELQSLVIASCLDQIYAHHRQVIVIVPEAWEFLPRARRSPVTVSAEAFIRKGAALQNFLWIDSQDLSGVHTPILKQIQIWLLGVQREINEIKRTIAHVHGAGRKLTVDQIAGLDKGQFVACWGSVVMTTYVQPVWLGPGQARNIARGEQRPMGDYRAKDTTVTKTEADRLVDENTALKEEIAKLREESRVLLGPGLEPGDVYPAPATMRATTQGADRVSAIQSPTPGASVALPAAFTQDDLGDATISQLIRGIKRRLVHDPELVQLLLQVQAAHPAIRVAIVPKVIDLDGDSPRGRLARMIANGMTDAPVRAGVFIKEFARTGTSIHPSRLTEHLSALVDQRVLVRGGDGAGTTYQIAPGVTVTTTTLTGN